LVGKKKANKKPPPFGEGFLLCCVCIFRREKITSGELPFASIKIAVNLG
jgi:hypothetical protein